MFLINLLQSVLMEKRLVKIGEAAQMLGVAISTLRKWEETGELPPTGGSHQA
jgi:DNA-binding transcriptional regulator YiaG